MLGCALAAGLMTFAPVQSQAANLIIGNSVYAPASIKLTYSFINKGKIQKVSVTSKEALHIAKAPKGSTLAYNYATGHIYVMAHDVVLTDLTANNVLMVINSPIISTNVIGKNGTFTHVEAGVVDVGFYSDGNPLPAGNQYSFEVTGTYAVDYSQSAANKNGSVRVSEHFRTANLAGKGYNHDISNNALPVTGSASASKVGKVVNPI